MKSWILFSAAWFSIAILQAILGYKWIGYSLLFASQTTSPHISEIVIALFCFAFFNLFRIVEIWRCHRLLKEYGEFVKSINKNIEVKKLLYQIKVSLFLILVGVGFSIFAGMLNHFNWIFLVMICILKFYYVSKFKKLINIRQENDDIVQKKS